MDIVKASYVAGTSRGPRSARTLALRMALEMQHQQEVAGRIRELRGLIPQPVIAERCGVTLRAYQEWEAGGGIKWENYAKVAAALRTTVEYLLHGAGEAHTAADDDQLGRIEAKVDAALALLKRLEAVALQEPPGGLGQIARGSSPTPQRPEQGNSPPAEDDQRDTG